MKLERLSENQIRCTLYKSDLADKELHLTELAYGTDKAKELFRELMQQDSDGGLGLADEADGESIVEDNPVNGLLKAIGGLAEDLSGLMSGKGVKPAQTNPSASDRRTEIPQAVEQPEIFRIYAFKNLDQVILSAKLVKGIYDSENSLYKNPRDSRFYLYMTKDKNTDNEFVKTCNLLGEYSNRVRATYATPSHMREHYKLIIDANALQTLAKL